MHLLLDEKIVLVTGSTSGIGKAIAEQFARENAHVYINGRTEETVNSTVQNIREKTKNQHIYPAVGDLSNVKEVAQVTAAVPRVDILINNTGIFNIMPFDKISDAEWTRFYDVNVMSGVRLSRKYFAKMLSQNQGSIVFISSEAAYCPKGFMNHYSMTKAAQLSISRGLAELTKGMLELIQYAQGPHGQKVLKNTLTALRPRRTVTPKL